MQKINLAMTSVNGWCVFLSLPTGSVKFSASIVKYGCLRVSLTQVDRGFKFVSLCFSAFGSSEKNDPCNELSLLELFHSFKICVMPLIGKTSLNTHHQYLNHKGQKRTRQLTRLFFPSMCGKIVWEQYSITPCSTLVYYLEENLALVTEGTMQQDCQTTYKLLKTNLAILQWGRRKEMVLNKMSGTICYP